ncbi:MAG: isoaspartyl peptidase/L-asparaginase family protein [Thermoanaerobaculia bacterium]
MIRRFITCLLLVLVSAPLIAGDAPVSPRPVLVIHGGAGTIVRGSMTPEREKEYRAKLEESLRAGHAVLMVGRSAVDAVEAAIRVMEDSPLFNAGKGAVFTHDGRNEMDASIMDGKTRKAGGVASVTVIRNPITAARAVMEKSPHVLLSGRGAEVFAASVGVEAVDPSYFWTEQRWKQLQNALEKERGAASGAPSASLGPIDQRYGTVGALALDKDGNLAAGTSTGGKTNKLTGRIGDSPVPGAGNWADELCAVSGTGDGEYFLRWAVAHEVASLVRYRAMPIAVAAKEVVARLKAAGGNGGLIALDSNGNHTMPMNTEGMYRGYIGADGIPHTAIYEKED